MKKRFLLIPILVISMFFNNLSGVQAASDAGTKTCASTGTLGFDTAIGCIPYLNAGNKAETNALAKFFLQWGIGVGGGVAFVLIVFASFQIMSSSGDPHRLQAGKELLTSALAGLLLIIFSVYILRIVGVDILKIPGF